MSIWDFGRFIDFYWPEPVQTKWPLNYCKSCHSYHDSFTREGVPIVNWKCSTLGLAGCAPIKLTEDGPYCPFCGKSAKDCVSKDD